MARSSFIKAELERAEPGAANASTPSSGLTPAREWILQRQHADMSENLRAAWTAYIQFYSVFLTFSVVALGWFLTAGVKWSSGVKPFIAWAFVVQSGLTAITSFGIALNSRQVACRQRRIERELLQVPLGSETGKLESAIPVGLAVWSGSANGVAMVFVTALWFYLRNH